MTLEATLVPPATVPPATDPAAIDPPATDRPATDPTAHSHAPVEAPGDATYGWEMFVAFTAAVVGISVAVAVLALVGSWWMLGLAMFVHVSVTATMMKLVLGAFGSEEHAYPDMHQAEAASRAAIARLSPSPALPQARLAM